MDWESLIWDTDIPAMRKFVMLAIARKADATGRAKVSVTEIAAITTMGRQTVYDQIAVAIQRHQLERIAPSLFRISLTHPDATLYATRTFSTPAVHAQIQADTPRLNHLVRQPYTEIPSPLNNPSSNPSVVLSPVLSFPPVLENKELGQEGISITRDGQGELISTDTPAWLTDLRTTPGYDLDHIHEQRLIQRVGNAAISAQRLCETASSIAAKWESIRWSPSNKRGYKRIDLTFVAWAKREGSNGKSPAIEVDRLEAYRRSYGRYMKAQ